MKQTLNKLRPTTLTVMSGHTKPSGLGLLSLSPPYPLNASYAKVNMCNLISKARIKCSDKAAYESNPSILLAAVSAVCVSSISDVTYASSPV